jgi:hypothetical protein
VLTRADHVDLPSGTRTPPISEPVRVFVPRASVFTAATRPVRGNPTRTRAFFPRITWLHLEADNGLPTSCRRLHYHQIAGHSLHDFSNMEGEEAT